MAQNRPVQLRGAMDLLSLQLARVSIDPKKAVNTAILPKPLNPKLQGPIPKTLNPGPHGPIGPTTFPESPSCTAKQL